MKRAATVLWLAGMALVVALIVLQGAAEVGSYLETAGWGLVGVCAYYPIALAVDTECWRLLWPPASRPRFRFLLAPRWICDAVNGLLPAAQIGGDVVRARLLVLSGAPGADAGASVVADLTAGVVTEILFTLLGIALLLPHEGAGTTTAALLAGVALFAVFVSLFFVAQRNGLFRSLARLLERVVRVGDWRAITGGAEALDAAVSGIYRRRRAFFLACLWRMAGWFAGAIEVWLALRFLGRPVGAVTAVMLESLGQAVRHAAFVVPGALGVQEGAFVLLCGAVGLGPDTGLALSLMKRIRELLLGLPALLVWQVVEGRSAWHRRKAA